jgi:hypothetical protein
MQNDRRKRAEEIAQDLRRCIEQAGFKVEFLQAESELTVAARDPRDEDGLTVVAQVSLRRAKPHGIGSIDHEVRRVRAAQVLVRPSLGVQAASGAPPDGPEIP